MHGKDIHNVAIYIRVSTQEQTENYSIEIQRERVEAYCISKGWNVKEIFVDGGFSGSSMDRPSLQNMLSKITDFDAVVVYKLDRLSRSQRDTMELIQDYFFKNKVDFASVTETLDTSTTFGMAMIGILAVFAELERGNIAERMRNGLIKRAQEGYKTSGGDREPSGYSRRPDGDLEPIAEEIEHIKMIFDYYERYFSITKVQQKLKEEGYPLWRFNRIRQILSNRLYIGDVSFAGEYYKGRHKPIITDEQFNRVQVMLEKHRGSNAKRAKQSLLSGLLNCGCCGEIYLTYSTNDKTKNGIVKRKYYICRARRFPSEYHEKCINKTWNGSKLESFIINEILLLENVFDNDNKANKHDSPNYQLALKRLDQKIEKILDLYTEGAIEKSLLNKRISKINAEKDNILQKQKGEKQKEESIITLEELKGYRLSLEDMDFSTKQAMVQKLIKSIVIKPDSINIEWNF